MGIFSKKTKEPLDASALAKKVEEYNQKFLASQEQSKSKQASSLLLLEDIDVNAVDVARTEMIKYVFEDMDEGPFSGALRSAFTNKKPNTILLTAASQVYLIALHTYSNPDYSDEERIDDTEVLKNYILKHYRDELYLIAVMTHAPIYAGMSVAKLIATEKGVTWDEAVELSNKALGTSMIDLHNFGLSLIQNFSKQS